MTATSNSTMSFQVYMKLEETEARALTILTQYGADAFLKVFYEHLGQMDLRKEEKGLRSLFDSIRDQLPQHLTRINKTRETFQKENPIK